MTDACPVLDRCRRVASGGECLSCGGASKGTGIAGAAFPDTSALSDEEFLTAVKARNKRGMQMGVDLGWWESFDARGPIPFPIIISRAALPENAILAHAIHAAGFADSVGSARKNGWNKPITLGRHVVDKMRHAILIKE